VTGATGGREEHAHGESDGRRPARIPSACAPNDTDRARSHGDRFCPQRASGGVRARARTRRTIDRLAAAYSGFADDARGRSPKQQPNLLLGAVKLLFGVAPDWPHFRAWAFSRLDEALAVIRTRSTQTNAPARCASLLPLLATLPPPLALLEVDASAGLCLLPDRYGYDYGRVRIDGTPTFACRASAATPLPTRALEVAWRAGLDLAPVDIHDPDQVASGHVERGVQRLGSRALRRPAARN
jgi:hypothetical protein